MPWPSNPGCPRNSLQFRGQWRGRNLRFKITGETNNLEIALESGKATAIWVNGELQPIGERATINLMFETPVQPS